MHLLVSHRNETEHVRTTSYLLVAPLDRLVTLAPAHLAIRGAAADEPDDWEYEGGEEATRREAPVAGATRCSARKALAARLGAARELCSMVCSLRPCERAGEAACSGDRRVVGDPVGDSVALVS